MHHGFPQGISSVNLQKRFNCFVKRYKDAKDVKTDTGGGLTPEESDQGITLEEKLNKMCPYFERMHALYGDIPNVSPCVLDDIGVEDDDLIHGEDEDEVLEKEVDWYIEDHGRSECMRPSTPTEILDGEVEVETPSWLKDPLPNNGSVWGEFEKTSVRHSEGIPPHLSDCICPQCRNFGSLNLDSNSPPMQMPDECAKRPSAVRRPLQQRDQNVQTPLCTLMPKKTTKTAQ
jgi:hypothetical protein